METKKKTRVDEIKDRLDPVDDPGELYEIIDQILKDHAHDNGVLSTIEDWLLDNYPTEEETKDIINTPKFWKSWCLNCRFRNHAKQTFLYEDTDGCELGQLPKVRYGDCQSHKTEFRNWKTE
jgi:hypothetical protein